MEIGLSDSENPRDYWYKMKIREKSESDVELSTICQQLKLKAPDGKNAINGLCEHKNYVPHHSIRGDRIRVVSARNMSKKERRYYQ